MNSSTLTSDQTSLMPRIRCTICQDYHPVCYCRKFRRMSYESRLRTAILHELCINCLETDHATSECLYENRCQLCDEQHHPLLHEHRKPTVESLRAGRPPLKQASSKTEPSQRRGSRDRGTRGHMNQRRGSLVSPTRVTRSTDGRRKERSASRTRRQSPDHQRRGRDSNRTRGSRASNKHRRGRYSDRTRGNRIHDVGPTRGTEQRRDVHSYDQVDIRGEQRRSGPIVDARRQVPRAADVRAVTLMPTALVRLVGDGASLLARALISCATPETQISVVAVKKLKLNATHLGSKVLWTFNLRGRNSSEPALDVTTEVVRRLPPVPTWLINRKMVHLHVVEPHF